MDKESMHEENIILNRYSRTLCTSYRSFRELCCWKNRMPVISQVH